MALIEEFVKKKIIDINEAVSIEKEMVSSEKTLDKILLSMDVSSSKIMEVKKEFFLDIPVYFYDETITIPKTILDYIPEDSAKRYHMVPLAVEKNELIIGMVNPGDLTAKTVLQFISSKIEMLYKINLISQEHYDHVLSNYSGVIGEVSKALGEYSTSQERELKKLQGEIDGDDVDDSDIIREDAPIAKIVSNIIKGAAGGRASDIHLEITEKEILVRYRIDGILEKSLVLPRNIHRAVVARIKILSGIKIDERRRPQDGRFSGAFLGRKIDFRVSTFPTYYGEKVVLRLLEQDRGALPIDKVGFTESNMKKIKNAISNSFGMILVCGPTGSGKTNTLYSLLNEVDRKQKNVVSLENPIELNVQGVSQSQVRPDIGYTFATGLRSILRQDPDIIMVGEIRDEETAKLAIGASLTGHLVLSTIHTNTAADVPQRLIDMGVEPYLIGPTLLATVGQRLVRTINPEARVKEPMSEEVKMFINNKISDLSPKLKEKFAGKNMYVTKSVKNNESGMKGRTAVFEILEMTDKVRRLILTDPSSLSIYDEIRKTDFITFVEDGILKALDGVTTFDEVMKL